ncbi:hypothetical protein H5410_056384 [Solanum commersonii]|uniref:Uncharacterized protein n=1 Tax=Solanum commersonii TaxID=4109 RepID=A0A9J5WL54_SOLCO|nr:hypothetical protein H5410_056384 [Solanum commersonii]
MVAKFSYGRLDLYELKKEIPIQLEIKGPYNIAVGKPLVIDKATNSQTGPSCARVKVEVDLLKELPKRIQINCIEEKTGTVRSKWKKIQYDYLPKYFTHCNIQGHDLQGCWILHPEHRPKREEKQEDKKLNDKGKDEEKNKGKHIPIVNGVFKNGKLIHENWNVVQNKNIKNKLQHDLNQKEYDTQQNHYKNKGHTDNKGVKVTTITNKFGTLVDLTDDKQDGAEKNVERSTSARNIKGEDRTKQWLTDLGFKRSMYTWWNGRSDAGCIFKRLDRYLGNQALQDLFPNLELEHLIK